jgi:hypothetical protein
LGADLPQGRPEPRAKHSGEMPFQTSSVLYLAILVMHHPRDSSAQLVHQSLKTYSCTVGYCKRASLTMAPMSTALCSSGAKYVWHSWMYFCCTRNDTAAVDHVINLTTWACHCILFRRNCRALINGREPKYQISLMIAASASDVLFLSLKDILEFILRILGIKPHSLPR